MENQVILQRRQPRDFVVNYPYGEHGNKEFKFMGSKGEKIYERPIPMEVFEWLSQNTTTLKNGDLIIKPSQLDGNEDLAYERENIENIDEIESAIFTRKEIIEKMETGNHNTFKKALKEISDGKSENTLKIIKKQFIDVASEVGIDSSAKRKILCDWVGLDFEISEAVFDKNIEELSK